MRLMLHQSAIQWAGFELEGLEHEWHPVPLGRANFIQHFTGYGESYEDNAVRELEEEMGITGACLETLFDFWYSDNTCRLWGRLFR